MVDNSLTSERSNPTSYCSSSMWDLLIGEQLDNSCTPNFEVSNPGQCLAQSWLRTLVSRRMVMHRWKNVWLSFYRPIYCCNAKAWLPIFSQALAQSEILKPWPWICSPALADCRAAKNYLNLNCCSGINILCSIFPNNVESDIL